MAHITAYNTDLEPMLWLRYDNIEYVSRVSEVAINIKFAGEQKMHHFNFFDEASADMVMKDIVELLNK